MEQPVVIKSNKYGLSVILDSEPDFASLRAAVAEKFAESKKFFKGAELAVAFEGRELSQEEQVILVQEMIENAGIKVPCIVDADADREAVMRQAVRRTAEAQTASQSPESDGKFYKGTLRSGQVLPESETSIIILGDVNPGATVVSKGNVIVLGTLKGSIYVGAAGNENTFVAALSMDPMQIRIADYIARNSDSPDKKEKKKKKDKPEEQPMIAYVDAGNIYIEPITKEVLADINL